MLIQQYGNRVILQCACTHISMQLLTQNTVMETKVKDIDNVCK